LLTPHVDDGILKKTLPRKPDGKHALVSRITRRDALGLSRIHAALIARLGCLAFESQGTFASQR
jgi:hypothetical protein